MFGLLSPLQQFLTDNWFTAAVFGIAILYIWRGKSAAGTIIGTMSTLSTIAIGTLAALAISVAAGWFEPNPDAFFQSVTVAASSIWDLLQSHIGSIAEVVP